MLDIERYRHLLYCTVENQDLSQYPLLMIVEKQAENILPYSQRYNPNLTLHGVEHSIRVIDNINKIIDVLKGNDIDLNEVEMELLYCSAWYHDIGLLLSPNEYSNDVSDKIKHGRKSADMIRKYHELTNGDTDSIEALSYIVESHSYGFKNVPEHFSVNGINIRLCMMCSILCLADLCDYNKYRAQKIVYDIFEDELEPEEKEHWIANRAVEINIDVGRRIIFVSKKKNVDCHVILDTFEKYAPMHIGNIQGLDLEIEYIETEEDFQ